SSALRSADVYRSLSPPATALPAAAPSVIDGDAAAKGVSTNDVNDDVASADVDVDRRTPPLPPSLSGVVVAAAAAAAVAAADASVVLSSSVGAVSTTMVGCSGSVDC